MSPDTMFFMDCSIFGQLCRRADRYCESQLYVGPCPLQFVHQLNIEQVCTSAQAHVCAHTHTHHWEPCSVFLLSFIAKLLGENTYLYPFPLLKIQVLSSQFPRSCSLVKTHTSGQALNGYLPLPFCCYDITLPCFFPSHPLPATSP